MFDFMTSRYLFTYPSMVLSIPRDVYKKDIMGKLEVRKRLVENFSKIKPFTLQTLS